MSFLLDEIAGRTIVYQNQRMALPAIVRLELLGVLKEIHYGSKKTCFNINIEINDRRLIINDRSNVSGFSEGDIIEWDVSPGQITLNKKD